MDAVKDKREGKIENPPHVVPTQECWADLEPPSLTLFRKTIDGGVSMKIIYVTTSDIKSNRSLLSRAVPGKMDILNHSMGKWEMNC